MKKTIYLSLLGIFIVALTASQLDNQQELEMNTEEYELILPDEPYDYEALELPEHYQNGFFGVNPMFDELENAKVALGRVIFYDRDLSINRTIACAECHQQQRGFADDLQFSEGFNGMTGSRNALHIADLGIDTYGRFLWDDSQSDLQEMVLLPLQDGDEMGITIQAIIDRMYETEYYPILFAEAYGSADILPNRISEAIKQFVASIVAVYTKLDQGIMNDFADFTEEELAGKTVFNQHCATCHNTPTSEFGFEGPSIIDPFLSFQPHNTGLDELTTDLGVANHSGWEGDEGKFKTVNLKNVALTGPYMHDGRFETLEDVVDFYSDEIQNHPNSTFTTQPQYIDVDIFPQPFAGFGFTDQEKSDLVTFLHTLTDEVLINSPMWSDPFQLVAVGVEENLFDAAINIGPNPFQSYIDVDFGTFPNEQVHIRLMNLNGQVLKTAVTQNRRYTFSRGNLPAGNYLLEITKGVEQSVKKIVAL